MEPRLNDSPMSDGARLNRSIWQDKLLPFVFHCYVVTIALLWDRQVVNCRVASLPLCSYCIN